MQRGGNAYCDTSRHGAQIDNYQLARNNSITLRLDELNSAISTLMSTAQTTSNSTPYTPPPAYQFSINSMDSPWQIGFTNLMSLTSNYVSGWTAASANFGVMEIIRTTTPAPTPALERKLDVRRRGPPTTTTP